MGSFNKDTYIVLDIPKKISKEIRKIREGYRYPESLPVEITLAGSSGIGVFQPEQNQEEVFAEVNKIAHQTEPLRVSFSKVESFPNTNIFIFTLQNEEPLRKLHREIKNSQIKFEESPFPYKPHCTLCNLPFISEEEKQKLLNIELPEEFTLDTLSVYSLEDKTSDHVKVNLLHRVELSG